jgi:hypothetical protein
MESRLRISWWYREEGRRAGDALLKGEFGLTRLVLPEFESLIEGNGM